MSKTKVFKEKFGRHNIFAIYEVDEEGHKKDGEDSKPIIKFGAKKAAALNDHVQELEKFAKENCKWDV